MLEHPAAALVTELLSVAIDAAEAAARFGRRGVARKSRGLELARFHLEMKAHFVAARFASGSRPKNPRARFAILVQMLMACSVRRSRELRRRRR